MEPGNRPRVLNLPGVRAHLRAQTVGVPATEARHGGEPNLGAGLARAAGHPDVHRWPA